MFFSLVTVKCWASVQRLSCLTRLLRRIQLATILRTHCGLWFRTIQISMHVKNFELFYWFFFRFMFSWPPTKRLNFNEAIQLWKKTLSGPFPREIKPRIKMRTGLLCSFLCSCFFSEEFSVVGRRSLLKKIESSWIRHRKLTIQKCVFSIQSFNLELSSDFCNKTFAVYRLQDPQQITHTVFICFIAHHPIIALCLSFLFSFAHTNTSQNLHKNLLPFAILLCRY